MWKHTRAKEGYRILRLLLICLIGGTTWAQAPSIGVTANSENYLTANSLPGVFERHASALGTRVTTPGNERVTFTGTLTQAGGHSAITVTYELPGKVRVQYGSNNRVASFDGNGPVSLAGLNDDDEALLEALENWQSVLGTGDQNGP